MILQKLKSVDEAHETRMKELTLQRKVHRQGWLPAYYLNRKGAAVQS